MSVLPAVLRPSSAAKSRRGERLIEFFLRAAAAIGVVTTVGIVTVLVIIYLFANLIVDLLYGVLDPRIRYE
jgi:hypothetical protein